jgi:hypothetical protein
VTGTKFSANWDLLSHKELQKETKTFKKNIIILIIISLCSLILSALRKEILGKSFWFIIDIVLANVVVAIILLRKIKHRLDKQE